MLAVFLIGYILFFTNIHVGFCGSLDVNPKYVVVKVGDPIVVLCSSHNGEPMDICRIQVPGNKPAIRTKPNMTGNTEFQYFGDGLDKGHCGFRIEHATEAYNGVFTCSAFIGNEYAESTGSMMVVVSRTPSRPELMISPGSDSAGGYLENEVFIATCRVRNSRPATNITWFLDEEVLESGISEPYFTSSKDKLYNTEQNVTRAVKSSDNGKKLRCVADHIGLNEQNKEDGKVLGVYFKPKSVREGFEEFGMAEGDEGKVKFIVDANPRPIFIWNVDGKAIVEGEKVGRYKVLETTKQEASNLWESILVISTVTKEDLNKKYKVEAQNKVGQQTYIFSTATSVEVDVSKGGGTVFFIIVIAIILIVIISFLFIWAKGRWRFSDSAAPRLAGESSDTESVDHTNSNNRKKASFISVLKIKREKELSNVGEENQGVAIVDDEYKIDTRLRRVDMDPPGNTMSGQQSPNTTDYEGVVYAELDLHSRGGTRANVVRGEDDKIEYAEIIHTKPQPK